MITNTEDNCYPALTIGSTANISAGSYTGAYLAGYAKTTVEDCAQISGSTGIEIRAGELTVNGGTITGTATSFSATANGSGATVEGAGIAVSQHTTGLATKVTVAGGTVSGYNAFYQTNVQGNSDDAVSKVELALNGGTFKATGASGSAVYSQNKTGFVTAGTFETSTGAADTSVSTYCASGNTIDSTTGTVMSSSSVAKVTTSAGATMYYDSLANAVTAAMNASGSMLTLLSNVSIESSSERIVFTSGDVTLDLNGHSVTAGTGVTAIAAGGSASLTIKDSSTAGAGTVSGCAAVSFSGNATLTIESGTFVGIDADTSATTEAKSGSSNTIAVAATSSDSAHAYIKGGVFKNSATTAQYTALLDQTNSDTTARYTVSGGTFYGKSPASDDNAKDVNQNRVNYLAQNYKVTSTSENGVTVYTVARVSGAAKIGDIEYESLAEAFAAAESDETVTLMANITVETAISVSDGRSITLDLAGYSVTGVETTKTFVLSGSSTLTVTDGSGASTGSVSGGPCFYVSDTAKLNINGGTYSALKTGGSANTWAQVVSVANSSGTADSGPKVTITGGTFGLGNGVDVTWKSLLDQNNSDTVPRFTVTGGTFTGFNPANGDDGHQSGSYVPTGYLVATNGNIYTVSAAVASVTANNVTEYYATVQAAVDAAASGAKVTMLADATENVTIAADDNLTLDLNGHTLSGGTDFEADGTTRGAHNNKAAITNNGGTITIQDSSEAKTGTIKRDDGAADGEAKAAIDNNSYYVLYNKSGTMNITSGNFVNESGYGTKDESGVYSSGSSLICNADTTGIAATLNITGGTFTQKSFICIKNGEYGTLKFGGSAKAVSNGSAVQNWCTATIEGGTLEGQLTTWGGTWSGGGATGKTSVTGGTITGDVISANYNSGNTTNIPETKISGGAVVQGSLIAQLNGQAATTDSSIAKMEVSGGTFSKQVPYEYCASGYVPGTATTDSEGNATYTVGAGTSVAAVWETNGTGDVTYCTDLSAAVSAITTLAQAGKAVSIKLLGDVEGTNDAGFNIASGVTVTLDLNGRKLIGKNAGPWIVNNGTLTINDSSKTDSGEGTGAIYTTNIDAQGRVAVNNKGTLIINAGWFGDSDTNKTNANSIQRGNAVQNNGGTVTINGGHFTNCDNYTGPDNGFSYPLVNNSGTMTVVDADVYGNVNGLVGCNGGTLNVQGGSYTLGDGTANNLYYLVYTSGAGIVNVTGGTFARNVAKQSSGGNNTSFFTADGGSSQINIDGGTFEDKVNDTVLVGGESGTAGKVSISGGTFNDGISATSTGSLTVSGGTFTVQVPLKYCAENYMPAAKGADGKYTVAEGTAVASITSGDVTTYFSSLQSAIAAATDGQTVKLIANATETSTAELTGEKSVTLDLNGKTATSTASVAIKNNGSGTLTITGNGTVSNTGYTGNDGIAVWARTGNVVIENGSFTNKSNEEATIYAGTSASTTTPTITIKGGTFKNEAEGSYTWGSALKPLTLNVQNGKPVTSIIVSGGTFYGNDPAKGDDILGGTFLADGYKATASEDGSYYTVGQKTTYTVTVTAKDTGSNTVSATLTGGGAYAEGSSATVVAPDADPTGCTFVGWYAASGSGYDSSKSLSAEKSYTFTVSQDTSLVAVYKATGGIKVTVNGGGKSYTLNGSSATTEQTKDYTLGDSITVVASGENFNYWRNGFNMVVSREASYTFTAAVDVQLTAVYKDTDATAEKMIVVWESDYGQVLKRVEVSSSEIASLQAPELPSRYGYNVTGWDQDATQLTFTAGSLVTIKPVSTLITQSYTVTVTNGTADKTSCNVNDVVTVTANAAESGKKFSHWTDAEGNTLSYSSTYSFYVTKDISLTANYVDESATVDAKGTAKIIQTTYNATSKTLQFVSLLSVPEDCTIAYAGIVATSNSSDANSLTKDNAAYVRGTTDSQNMHVRFTWTKSSVEANATWYAKAYLVYTTQSGETVEVYGDLVTVTAS